MDTWRNLCTNACAQYVGPGNCLPEQSVASRRVGDRGGLVALWRMVGTACQQGQATASAAYGRQVAYGGFPMQKPNWNRTEPKPKRCDAMRNETQPKRTCFSIKNVEKRTKNSFELPTVDTQTDSGTHPGTRTQRYRASVQRQVINGTYRGILDAQKSQLCEFNEFRSFNALFNCLRYGKRMEKNVKSIICAINGDLH